MNEPCHIYAPVMSHVWMSHISFARFHFLQGGEHFRMPYLCRSHFAKEPYSSCLLCGKRPGSVLCHTCESIRHMCCSALQYVAVCCSVLQRFASSPACVSCHTCECVCHMCCSELQRFAGCCGVLQRVAVLCSELQYTNV